MILDAALSDSEIKILTNILVDSLECGLAQNFLIIKYIPSLVIIYCR